MSALSRLIGTVRYAGMRFAVDDDRLIVTGNTARLTDDLKAKIKHHKPEIIAVVNRLPDRCIVPQACMDIGACGPGYCEQARDNKNIHKPCTAGRQPA